MYLTAARRIAAVAVLTAASACASGGARGASLEAPTQDVVSDRLYFGFGIPGGGEVSDSAWTAFLRDVVTPRFPAGFSVFRAGGQWLDARGVVVREPAMVFEVHHPRGSPPDSVFAAIANEYIRRFRQEAVLRTTSDARMQMYDARPVPP